MKNFVLLMLCFALLILMVSCIPEPDDPHKTASTTAIVDIMTTNNELATATREAPVYTETACPVDVISKEEAISIARKYWENHNIDENGYLVEAGNDSLAPYSVYVVLIKRYIDDHWSAFDEIWIDKNTGDIIAPYEN